MRDVFLQRTSGMSLYMGSYELHCGKYIMVVTLRNVTQELVCSRVTRDGVVEGSGRDDFESMFLFAIHHLV